MTIKQVTAVNNMVSAIQKESPHSEFIPEMPRLWKVDFNHIKSLLNTGKINNLNPRSYQTERIFAFLSDSVANVEDHYDYDIS